MIHVNARGIIVRNNDNKIEIVVQIRHRAGEAECYELPGGRIEEFESITDALKREVYEETGLRISEIYNEVNQILSEGPTDSFTVQCIKPFAVYQTLQGPVDSFGVYFICKAEGELLKNGDDTKAPCWRNIHEVCTMIADHKFSAIDKPAVQMFLKEPLLL